MKATLAVIAAIVAVVAVLYVATVPNSAPSSEMIAAEVAQHEADVTAAINARWAQYAQGRDLDSWTPLWAPNIRVMEAGVDMSGDDFLAFGRDFFTSGGQVFSFEMETFDIYVHGSVAYQIGRMDESFQFPDGEPTDAHNFFFARWEEQPDGSWGISRMVAGTRDAPVEG